MRAWLRIVGGWGIGCCALLAADPAVPVADPAVQVDRYGQDVHKDFPGKVHDDADLTGDVARDAEYFAGFAPLALDAWGGQPGSGVRYGLHPAQFFHTEQHAGKWFLVTPEGNACFHLGICSFGANQDFTYLKGRRGIYAWLPPSSGPEAAAWAATWHPDAYWHDDTVSFYLCNVLRKYGPPLDYDAQLGRLVERVKRVGFNAVGSFTGESPAFAAAHFPRVGNLPQGKELPGVRGIFDPYDDAGVAALAALYAKTLEKHRGDPLMIGYFIANEQAFEDIPRGIARLPGTHAAKQELARQLAAHYPTIAAFNAAWGTTLADFTAVRDQPLPVTTAQADADLKAYAVDFLERYYQTVETLFRKNDPDHLLLGSRWQPGTANNEVLCRTAGKHVDVISLNYYTTAVDPLFTKRLYDWTGGKPQLWSEFNYSSQESNNGGIEKSQRVRGQAYRAYVERAAQLGYVIGVEWFTLTDQSITGRWFQKLNGERFNTGLFNVADRPYRDLLAEMAEANRGVYAVMAGERPPYQAPDPRFSPVAGAPRDQTALAAHALGAIALDGSAQGWPVLPPERIGAAGLSMGSDATGFEGSFRCCWDEQRLYLQVTVTDPTPGNNTQAPSHLWNGDCVELFLGHEALDQPGTLLFSDRHVLLAGRADGGGQSWVDRLDPQPEFPVTSHQVIGGGGTIIEAALPWSALGVAPHPGLELRFDLGLDDAQPGTARTRQLMWNGGARNSSDRTAWGRLRLIP